MADIMESEHSLESSANGLQTPHAVHDDIEKSDFQQQQQLRSNLKSSVQFSEHCTEHDENGKCKKRRLSMLPNPMRMMSQRRRSSAQTHHGELLSLSRVKQTGSVISLLVPLLCVLSALLIPAYCVPLIVDMHVPQESILLPIATSCVVVVPVLMFLKWCGYLMKNSFDFGVSSDEGDDDTSVLSHMLPSIPLICIALGIIFRQARHFVEFRWDGTYSSFYKLLLDYGAAMCIFTAAISGLDSVHGSAILYAKKVDSIAANKQSTKWKSIMKSFRSFDDAVKDKASAIPGGHRSPAQVLADIVGIYANIGKILSMTLALLFFLGIDLYSNSVAIGLTVIFAGLVTALHIQDATMNVISLSVSNAVHVGDIISLGRPGFTPADNPGNHIAGFLEGVTWGHVIIRDFKRKQTFIRHDEFGKLVMQNWARRPNKHAHFIIPVVPELSGGADRLAKLADYCGDWIRKHPFIDQDGYQKSVIKWVKDDGLVLEAIFFPAKGGKARKIRAEFVTMILEAAKRLNLCLMPAEVRTSTPWSVEESCDSDFESCQDH